MAERTPRHLILTGFSTTGKSTVGQAVARALGVPFRDTDAVIEQHAGRSIADLFATEGETAFRAREHEQLMGVLAGPAAVIATGGGIVVRDDNRAAMRQFGIIVRLEASVETIQQRLAQQRADEPGAVRPLLQHNDPRARIESLRAARAAHYADCDWTIHTDRLSPDEVAAEALRAWQLLQRRLNVVPAHGDSPVAHVSTPSASYPINVGAGILGRLGERMRSVGLNAVRAFVIADAAALQLHGASVLEGLRAGGFEPIVVSIPSGETSKSLDETRRLYHWLADHRAERKEPVVAFGGGVAGDLAGFVAASYLRGVPLVQVPTTLLAMTDSAIGGKTGVNLPHGKNLVGAFHQPRLVVADVLTLASLPERELVAGWAETIKHAFIRDPELLARLETDADRALARDPDALVGIIGRSVGVKASVVSADEREDGLRMILNYGHTFGHAIEAAGDYTALLHGEAVSIGMVGEARLGERMGVTPAAVAERQYDLLVRFRLPTQGPPLPLDRVVAALALDKKVAGKRNRFVLLEDVGRTVIRDDAPDDLARAILAELVQ